MTVWRSYSLSHGTKKAQHVSGMDCKLTHYMTDYGAPAGLRIRPAEFQFALTGVHQINYVRSIKTGGRILANGAIEGRPRPLPEVRFLRSWDYQTRR